MIQIPEKWDDLIRNLWLLRPIHNETDYNTALSIADELTARKKLNKDQVDYLESLTTLIEAYEAVHYPIDVSRHNPLEILKSLLEANHLNGSELGRILGQRQLGSKILNGTRELSKTHIKGSPSFSQLNPVFSYNN